MPKKKQICKYLHILPADTDVTYWFLKTMEKSDDLSEHSFLIAANEKTVLKRYTKLLEFPYLLYLSGGTEGKDAKKRYSLLKENFSSAQTIIWHGIGFDTIDIVRAFHRNRKANKKSIWICQSSEIKDIISPSNDKRGKIIKHIISLFKRIGCTDEALISMLAEILGKDETDIAYVPYLLDPDIFNDFVSAAEQQLSLEEDEPVEQPIEDELDEELLSEDEADDIFDDDDEVERPPVKLQLDFSPDSSAAYFTMLKRFKGIDLSDVRMIVPSDVWLNGVKVVKSKVSPALKGILGTLFQKNYTVYHHSFGAKTFSEYLSDIDAIVICSDMIVKPIYLYLAIAWNKTFIIDKANPYVEILNKLDADVVFAEDISDQTFAYLREKQSDPTLTPEKVRCYFDKSFILKLWNDLY